MGGRSNYPWATGGIALAWGKPNTRVTVTGGLPVLVVSLSILFLPGLDTKSSHFWCGNRQHQLNEGLRFAFWHFCEIDTCPHPSGQLILCGW